jgi:DNA-binding MarR family transcriptional regulator
MHEDQKAANRDTPGATFDPPGGGLGYALMQAANAWRAELATALSPIEITPAQFFVISALLYTHSRERPPPTQAELANRTGSDVNTTSQVLRGLERRELVERVRHPGDSRALAITLTEQGLAVAREATTKARALNRVYFDGVDGRELLASLTGLTRASHGRADDRGLP